MSISLYGGNKTIDLKWWTFPGGERNVKIIDPVEIQRFNSFTVKCDFKGSDDLIDMLLLVNAIRNVSRNVHLRLYIPYFPFARQDRVMTVGEPHALAVATALITSCNFYEIEVLDPHSDVLEALVQAVGPGILKIKTQWDLWVDFIISRKVVRKNLRGVDCCWSNLVSPDAGAAKKIYKLAKLTGVDVVEASKIRDVSTGEIIRTEIDCSTLENAYDVYIVDDICDGGRTFIELAAAIRGGGYRGKLILCVTHGIFSKGLDCLSCFNEIHTINNMSGLDIESFNLAHKDIDY